MKRGRGKAKGSAFERKIAKELSLWLTRGKDDKQLIRSVLSGGWKGAREKDGWRQVGDLAPNGPLGEKFRKKFAIECKHRKQINLLTLWQRSIKGDLLPTWWRKLVKDSKAAGVTPMLIFRSNGFPVLVILPTKYARRAVDLARNAHIGWLDVDIIPFAALCKSNPNLFLGE